MGFARRDMKHGETLDRIYAGIKVPAVIQGGEYMFHTEDDEWFVDALDVRNETGFINSFTPGIDFPNVAAVTEGLKVRLKVTRTIKQGEEMLLDYGPGYNTHLFMRMGMGGKKVADYIQATWANWEWKRSKRGRWSDIDDETCDDLTYQLSRAYFCKAKVVVPGLKELWTIDFSKPIEENGETKFQINKKEQYVRIKVEVNTLPEIMKQFESQTWYYTDKNEDKQGPLTFNQLWYCKNIFNDFHADQYIENDEKKMPEGTKLSDQSELAEALLPLQGEEDSSAGESRRRLVDRLHRAQNF